MTSYDKARHPYLEFDLRPYYYQCKFNAKGGQNRANGSNEPEELRQTVSDIGRRLSQIQSFIRTSLR